MAAASFDADVTRHASGGSAVGRGLGVHAASRKIGKPAGQQERKPVIIYMVSPKIIHVEAHEFMPLVQRLTGPGADKKKSSRPSVATSGAGGPAGSSSPREEESEGGIARSNKARSSAPAVRVKARALNRPAGGPAVSVSVTATTRQHQQEQQGAAAPPSVGLLFHDLSPLRGAALKGEHHAMVSPGGWLHHVGGDHFLSSPGTAAATLGSPSGACSFLDIFGPLSSSQQQ